MAMLVRFSSLPTKADAPDDLEFDIAGGRLSVTDSTGVTKTVDTATDQSVVENVALAVGAAHAEFVYVDPSGNVSKNPLVLDFQIADTIAPPDATGAITVETTGQVDG